MLSDLLDCRQLYIGISHFCHAADEVAAPSLISHAHGAIKSIIEKYTFSLSKNSVT
jgi:hypothetical protein